MSNCSIIRKIAPLLWEREESQNRQGAPSFPVLEICNYSFHILREWNYPRNFGQYWRLYWNQANGAKITIKGYVRFETGEGLEKKEEDFAAEVAKQMAGN